MFINYPALNRFLRFIPALMFLCLMLAVSVAIAPRVFAETTAHAQKQFNIPAGALGRALSDFALQAGITISFDANKVKGLSTKGLQKNCSIDEGFAALLAGSQFIAETSDAGYSIKPISNAVMQMQPISVLGEKVERSYMDTYTSVAVATANDLDSYHIDDLRDSFNNMANVRMFTSNSGNNGFQIRGLNADGVTQPQNSAPLISLIIDGATQSAEGMKRGARGVWDVKQIEVLRGPQSTLQGRNALAGAVVVKTNDPSYEPELIIKGGAGESSRRSGALAASLPVIDQQVAVRLSAERQTEEKDIHYSDPANELLGDDEYRNVRGKLLVEPDAIEGLKVLLTASKTFDRPSAATVTDPDFFARSFSNASAFTEFREMDVDSYIADISYQLSERLSLHSLSSSYNTKLALTSAPTSTVFIRDDKRKDDDVSQDLRLEIAEDGNGLSGVVGLFYGDFSQHVDSYINVPGFGGVIQDGVFVRETKTKAVYTDLRYRLTDQVVVLGGFRYQKDKVHNLIDYQSVLGNQFSDQTVNYNVFLPKYGLAFDLDDQQTVALTAAKGYRQGFTEVLGGTNQVNEISPEFMWTYELAYRLSLLNERFTLGANLFYNDYEEQQVSSSTLNPGFTNTFNVGDSESYGLEIEGRYAHEELSVFAAVGLLKTKFKDFIDSSCTPSGGNCRGNEYPEAPALTFSVGGSYKLQSGLFFSADANYTDDYFTFGEINNRSNLKIASRLLANAKVGYQYENMKASLYVDNLFDKDYITGISPSSSGDSASIGDGRTIGVDIVFEF